MHSLTMLPQKANFLLLLFASIIGCIYAFTCNGIDSNDPNVCSSHGVCIADDVCICHTGYEIGYSLNNNETCAGILRLNRPSVSVYGIGDSTNFQLQETTTTEILSLYPQTVNLDTNDKVLFSIAGILHSSVCTVNKIYAWGQASRVGINTGVNLHEATSISETAPLQGKKVIIMDSYDHTIVVTDENELYGWGGNDFKIDGSGTTYTTPTLMVKGNIGTKKIAAVSCGRHITLYLTSDGTIYSQGKNQGNPLLGIPDIPTEGTQPTPATVGLLDGYKAIAISSGDTQTHAIAENGIIYGWGNRFFTGTTGNGQIPTALNPLPNNEFPIRLYHSASVAFVLTREGHIFSWGFSWAGALGLDSNSVSQPTQIVNTIGDKFIKLMSARNEFAAAVDNLGIVYYWGELTSNISPQSTIAQLNTIVDGVDLLLDSRVADISVGSRHALVDFYTIPYCYGIRDDEVNVCSSHGLCSGEDACDCYMGYSGLECERTICYNYTDDQLGLVCSGNGTCISPDHCECDDGYAGDECEIIICFGIYSNDSSVCSGNGTCIAPDTCACDFKHNGSMCEIVECYGQFSNESTTCSGNGECIAPDTCLCEDRYFGDQCEIAECYSKLSNETTVCSGNGECIASDTCLCEDRYFGDQCEIAECYSKLSNETTVCSGNGECIGRDSCSCDPGYFGDECEVTICFSIFSNDSNVCSGNGACESPDFCNCDNDYYGSQCDVVECFSIFSNESNVCSGRGSCIAPNQCDCFGYFGEECEVSKCFEFYSNETTVCSGNGTCIDTNNCTCSEGYIGLDCEIYACYSKYINDSTVCSGNGTCIGPNSCECFEGFDGDECEYYNCYGKLGNDSCSGLGSCVGFNQCSCVDGYFGDECNMTTCNGVVHTDPNVCSGGGSCIAYNTCLCNAGFNGTNCEDFICYNVSSSDPSVCSGHGNCTFIDQCSCETNFQHASDCSVTTCHSVYSNDILVCNGRGPCIDLDVCDCHSNFTGSDCSLSYCGGILSDSPSVCSGNGVCVNLDQCDCYSNYSGANCEITSCFNVPSNNATVCSGNGQCTKWESCNCSSGWMGVDCSVAVPIRSGAFPFAVIIVPVASLVLFFILLLIVLFILIFCCIMCIFTLSFFCFKRSSKVRVLPAEPLGNLDEMKDVFEDTKSDISYMGIYKKSSVSLDEFGSEEFSSNDGLFNSSFIWTRSNKQRIHPVANLSLHGGEDTDSEHDISDQVVKNLVDLLKKKQEITLQNEVTGEFDTTTTVQTQEFVNEPEEEATSAQSSLNEV